MSRENYIVLVNNGWKYDDKEVFVVAVCLKKDKAEELGAEIINKIKSMKTFQRRFGSYAIEAQEDLYSLKKEDIMEMNKDGCYFIIKEVVFVK